MFNIFNFKRVSLQILIISIFFSFVKLEISNGNFEDLKIDNKNYNNTFEGNKYYHINYTYGNNTNFIKIQLEGIDNENEYLIKYYYKDEKNIHLNQSAKSYSKNAIMWLNKEQIAIEFYLGFECRASPCKYNFIIEPKDKVELKIGETYTYYVNEQSLKMSFSIEGSPISYFPYDNNTEFKLSVWAKGYKKIDSKIEEKESDENAYIIPILKDKNFNYLLEVNATQGDLINVGALLFDNNNICQTPIKSFKGEEINGIFDANEMKQVCFIFEDSDLNILYSYGSSVKRYTELSEQEHNSQKIRCLNKINDNFYSFHITKNKDDLNILNALIGKSYNLEMKEGEKIGIIPMILVEEKSNYLTYHIKKSSGVYNSDIFSLNDYPFYNISKAEKLEGSYFVSYINDELKDFYSPIGPNQKLLLISCVNYSCSININIFDYNTRISVNKLMPFYNYIRKDTENKLQLSDLDSSFNYMLFFESLSGPHDQFTIDFGNITQIDNKGIYEIKPNVNQNSFNLNLKSKENHIYNLAAIKFKENGNEGSITAYLISDINYMFKFNNKTQKYHIDLNNLNTNQEYYLFINSKECNIDLDNNNNKIIKIENNSYGYFYNSNSNKELMVTKVNSGVENCRFDISLFQYKQSNNELNYIILSKDKPHTFVFYNDGYKQVKYMHIFTKKDLGLKLKIKLKTTNITKAKLELYYNTNKKIHGDDNLDDNYNKDISHNDISQECKDNFKPCTIIISLTLDKIKGGETAEVSIGDSDYISKMKKLYLILTVAGGGVLFLIIVIIIICACKNRNSYAKLTKEVNAISFKEDEDKGDERTDSKADDLLY